MSDERTAALEPIGVVRSSLRDRASAPRQGAEGAPSARLEIDARFAAALDGLAPGDAIVVLTWFHLARRDVLITRPRSDPRNPLTGVFATRSPDRPNPIGLHPVTIVAIEGTSLVVAPLEAIDGTPILDLKPVIPGDPEA
jgi:tRNA-Thr(GGU) m(6)t(6)A37 methyltransferase TsaA